MIRIPPRLVKERAVLVVVDMQERFRDLIDGMPQVIGGCSRLIRFCTRLDVPVLVTEHYPRGLGATLPELRGLFPEFRPLEKIAFSCAGDAGFREALRAVRRDQVILCGIETHVCVYQTASDLLREGLQVTVAADAVSSRHARNRSLGLDRMRDLGVQPMSTEMIMFEILRVARTPDFQAVADVLKEM
jgi:nicotinamidase-related amidase